MRESHTQSFINLFKKIVKGHNKETNKMTIPFYLIFLFFQTLIEIYFICGRQKH